MYVRKTIITNYLHINVNYHTKLLARKSLVFVYQPIKWYNKLMLHNLSSSLSHYSLIFLFYLYSSFLLQLLSFSFYVFIDVFYVEFFNMFFYMCHLYHLCFFFFFWSLFVFIYNAFVKILCILFNFSSSITKNLHSFLIIFKTITSCLFVSHLQVLRFFVQLR
jgi:hypothetical protein